MAPVVKVRLVAIATTACAISWGVASRCIGVRAACSARHVGSIFLTNSVSTSPGDTDSVVLVYEQTPSVLPGAANPTGTADRTNQQATVVSTALMISLAAIVMVVPVASSI